MITSLKTPVASLKEHLSGYERNTAAFLSMMLPFYKEMGIAMLEPPLLPKLEDFTKQGDTLGRDAVGSTQQHGKTEKIDRLLAIDRRHDEADEESDSDEDETFSLQQVDTLAQNRKCQMMKSESTSNVHTGSKCSEDDTNSFTTNIDKLMYHLNLFTASLQTHIDREFTIRLEQRNEYTLLIISMLLQYKQDILDKLGSDTVRSEGANKTFRELFRDCTEELPSPPSPVVKQDNDGKDVVMEGQNGETVAFTSYSANTSTPASIDTPQETPQTAAGADLWGGMLSLFSTPTTPTPTVKDESVSSKGVHLDKSGSDIPVVAKKTKAELMKERLEALRGKRSTNAADKGGGSEAEETSSRKEEALQQVDVIRASSPLKGLGETEPTLDAASTTLSSATSTTTTLAGESVPDGENLLGGDSDTPSALHFNVDQEHVLFYFSALVDGATGTVYVTPNHLCLYYQGNASRRANSGPHIHNDQSDGKSGATSTPNKLSNPDSSTPASSGGLFGTMNSPLPSLTSLFIPSSTAIVFPLSKLSHISLEDHHLLEGMKSGSKQIRVGFYNGNREIVILPSFLECIKVMFLLNEFVELRKARLVAEQDREKEKMRKKQKEKEEYERRRNTDVTIL